MSCEIQPAAWAGHSVMSRLAPSAVEYRPAEARLILVDADDLYRSIVKEELRQEGFSVADFPNGVLAAESLRAGVETDLVIADWGQEDSNGANLLQTVRDIGTDVPLIVLTERNSTIHERFALQQGAVDFICKSRGTQIVAARVRLILAGNRRMVASGQTLERGRLRLEGGRAYWGGVDVNLTVGEFKIVFLLATRVGEHVSYRQIYDALHYRGFVAGCGEDGYRANVRGAIKRIRSKFNECDPNFDMINNFIGFGYSWAKKGD